MATKRNRRIDVTAEVVEITPELAEEWLEANTGNFRKVGKARVMAYAQDIASGLWDLNGETIVFGADGQLKNGQHRLLAVVAANTAIWCVVVRGITCTGMHFDRGQPRRVSQWIAHGGVKNAAIVAAASRLCVGHEKGIWNRKGWGVDTMTDSEVITFAMSHHEAMNASIPGTRTKSVSCSQLVAVMFIGCGFRDINESETGRWFRDAIVTGVDIDDTDAVLHFRNKMDRNGSLTVTAYLTRMLLTLAWNKTVEGAECGSSGLRLRLTGPGKQKPPAKVIQVTDIEGK